MWGWIIALFDRRVERVHVDVENLARSSGHADSQGEVMNRF
jgi:hypothetical protein